jgi:hypothetical protein
VQSARRAGGAPAGLGSLLMDACRAQQLIGQGAPVPHGMVEQLLDAAGVGLSRYAEQAERGPPVADCLAFRELLATSPAPEGCRSLPALR